MKTVVGGEETLIQRNLYAKISLHVFPNVLCLPRTP